LQQQTEFDCFVKSFTYLAARLPRTEFLEPFLNEATVEPVEKMKKQMGVFMKMREHNLSSAIQDFDAAAIMAGMQLVLGKPSEAALQAGDLPLSEAEPDMYPCLLAMCGSGYGFFKVNVVNFHHCHRCRHHHHHLISIPQVTIGVFGDRPTHQSWVGPTCWRIHFLDLLMRYLENYWNEFHQTSSVDAFWDTDESFIF